MTEALNDFFARCPAMLFIADGDGSLVHVSASLRERFAARLGPPATLVQLATPDDREAIASFLSALADTEEPVTCSFRVPAEHGHHTHVRCEARRHADGPIQGWLDVVSQTQRIEHVLLYTLINTLDLAVWAIDAQGTFVFHDGKALATAGLARGERLGKSVFDLYPVDHAGPIHEALAGTDSHSVAEARGTHWETWYVALPDAAGNTEFCAGVSLDITTTVETERELRRRLDTIMSQQQAIRELSTPVIRVWDHVLTVPLIGSLDPDRVNELTERLLGVCSRSKARFVLVDMTGIDQIDTASGGSLIRLLDCLRLLGVEGHVTGLRPSVALTMTTLGFELGAFRTHRNLRDGLHACMLALQAK